MQKFFLKLGLPIDGSAHGAKLDQLNVIMHWIMLALFVVWGVFFVYLLIRFRRSRNPKADHDGMTTHISTYGEIAIVVIEAVLLLGFSIPLWAVRVDQFPKGDDVFPVRVLAEQFIWNFHYPGADGKFGKTRPDLIDPTENQMGLDWDDPNARDDVYSGKFILPVETNVVVRLTSKDVIHCIALPTMRIKQDVIPGTEIPLWFTTKLVHKSQVGCAQLCGVGHYKMAATFEVLSQPDFAEWYQGKIDEALEAADERDEGW